MKVIIVSPAPGLHNASPAKVIIKSPNKKRSSMEKQALWNKIISLTTQCTNAAMKKAEAVDNKDAEIKRNYHYTPSIKIGKTLPTDNAQEVQGNINYLHSSECHNAANKKLKKLCVLSILFMVVAPRDCLVPQHFQLCQ